MSQGRRLLDKHWAHFRSVQERFLFHRRAMPLEELGYLLLWEMICLHPRNSSTSPFLPL